MAAVEVAPGIHAIEGLPPGRAYLVAEADRLTLIDTGSGGHVARLMRAIAALRRRPEDLRSIVITHWHGDHTGNLKELLDRTGAVAMVHTLDAAIVRGERAPSPPDLPGLFAPLAKRMTSGRMPPIHVERELADGDEIDCLGGLRVVHTPGHTPGSICLHSPSRRMLFTGDAASSFFGPRPPLRIFTEDMAQAKRSLRRLAPLEFDVAFFGHGKPLDKDAAHRFRRAFGS